ncbi:head GIN domain-containing protein [Flavobacterium luteum]|uniref:DUF2807 domain-containing protein n=1 Tax=Flavobacterium luteum TaxID=2026654 RepID=A0A7J5A881_9FLAO|nr:head GIN domain-containing protein [Flavobacterium luteum]KAB1153766.1 DUF2807 domain-containing protein [Flavobacterium luteum]
MTKKIVPLLFILFFTSCEKPFDCVKSSGKLSAKVYEELTFTKIIVHKGIALVITQGDNYKVEVKTGENLINDIEVKSDGNTLTLEDNTTCNWVRDYGETTVYITAPNLTDIYCKTDKEITSNGTLKYENLRLISMNTIDGYNGVGTGDFVLQIDCEKLLVESNEVSRYYISGKANQASINFYEQDGIFHGENLMCNAISLFHRGSNHMFVHPLVSLSGDIYNVGNVFCYSRPSEENIRVKQHYKGKLIFK